MGYTNPVKQTQTAGGVVLGPSGLVLVVNQHGNSWSLPKGHIEHGEDARQAAVREIQEESGIQEITFVKELDSYQRHRIGKYGGDDQTELKTITMFLFTTNETKLQPEDPDNPEARWVKPADVEALLTHPKDKAFFAGILHEIRDEG